MNLSDLRSLFNEQLLSTAHRSLGLAWSPAVADVLGLSLLPQRAHIREGICERTEARLACVTTNAQLPVKLFIGVPFALTMTTDQGAKRLFPLIVTAASASHGDGALVTVSLEAHDPLWFMGQRRRLRTFRGRTVPQVIGAVLDDWIRNSPVGATFTYTWLNLRTDEYPSREQFVQHPDESDAEFVERLLRSSGIAWVWRSKPESGTDANALPQLELLLFDDGWQLPANAAPSMRFHRRDGTEFADTIDLLAPVLGWVPNNEDVRSWDYKRSAVASSLGSANLDQGTFGDDIARALDSVRIASPHLGDSAADLSRLANVQSNHQVFRSQCLRGRGGVRTMAPGTWQTIEGHGILDGLPAEDRACITVRVEHFAENSLPAELNDAAQAIVGDLGVPDWARIDRDAEPTKSEQRYSNLFHCVPRSVPIQPSYIAERDAPRRRQLSGIVVAHDGEITTDGLCRSLVRFIGGDPGADTTAWVRHPVPWGGKDHGHVTPMRAATEVDLQWLGPDRYVVVGSHYNGRTPPPRFDHLGGLPENRALSGIISRELSGERQQQLRFNDTPGDISVQLGTDDAATQLNIGSLATPMDRGRTQHRGRGFELRTDAAGAVRSAEALLISTWKRLQAMSTVLDAEEHQALIKDFADLFKSLGDHAGRHQGTAADTEATTRLSSDIRGKTAPTISITAPAGIASTTPRTIMNYAGVNIDSVAMQHYQVTAGGQYLMNAGNGATFFAHQGGLKAIAHHGRLLLQSQHDDTQIDSARDIKATALGKIVGLGQDEVTFMTSGGAYVKLAGGDIELGGPGQLRVRTASHHWDGPASLAGDLPTFSDGDLGRTPRLLRPTDGQPVAGVQALVQRDGDGDMNASTDDAGATPKLQARGLQRFKFFYRFPRR